jgi:hypothetical protein
MNVSWGTIITIFLSQAISTISSFYVLRLLNRVHSNGKDKDEKK